MNYKNRLDLVKVDDLIPVLAPFIQGLKSVPKGCRFCV